MTSPHSESYSVDFRLGGSKCNEWFVVALSVMHGQYTVPHNIIILANEQYICS